MNGVLPPPPINSPLRGYLDFFGIKNGGQNPKTAAPDLAPTMDMQRWYLESQSETFTFSENAYLAAGTHDPGAVPISATSPTDLTTGGSLFVPDHEIWILLPGTRVYAGMSAHAGSEISGVGLVSVLYAGSTEWEFVPFGPIVGYTTSAATHIRAQAALLDKPYWLPPGSQLNAWHYGATVGAGGDIDIAGTLKIVRLQS